MTLLRSVALTLLLACNVNRSFPYSTGTSTVDLVRCVSIQLSRRYWLSIGLRTSRSFGFSGNVVRFQYVTVDSVLVNPDSQTQRIRELQLQSCDQAVGCNASIATCRGLMVGKDSTPVLFHKQCGILKPVGCFSCFFCSSNVASLRGYRIAGFGGTLSQCELGLHLMEQWTYSHNHSCALTLTIDASSLLTS
jgi:hypothetical protein